MVWCRPTVAAILQVLKNPAYAGAFVYGRTRSVRAATQAKHRKCGSRGEWKFREGQVSRLCRLGDLRDDPGHAPRQLRRVRPYKTRGVPREGTARLHGMVYCGECGHQMVVQYRNGARYICNYLRPQQAFVDLLRFSGERFGSYPASLSN